MITFEIQLLFTLKKTNTLIDQSDALIDLLKMIIYVVICIL